MQAKRSVEVFSAGCPACNEVEALVRRLACPSCGVAVLDMHDPAVAAKAKSHNVRTVPAVVVDGRLAACCTWPGPAEAALRASGVGAPLP